MYANTRFKKGLTNVLQI